MGLIAEAEEPRPRLQPCCDAVDANMTSIFEPFVHVLTSINMREVANLAKSPVRIIPVVLQMAKRAANISEKLIGQPGGALSQENSRGVVDATNTG